MRKQEPQSGVDRGITRTAHFEGTLVEPDLVEPDPWQEISHDDFATGTSPGEILDEEPRAAKELVRTRITYGGDDTTMSEESCYLLEPDSAVDLLHTARAPTLADRTPLWQVVNPRVVCVRADLGTDSLLSMLFALDLRSVPVVDDVGRPIGVVSRSDLLRRPPHIAAERVADVMMCLAFALPETATLSRAAAVMAYEGVHQIPVVTSDRRVVGLISTLDVARWLAQHDGYLV